MKRFSLLMVIALVGFAAWADKQIGSYILVKTETATVANNLATNVAALTATSGVDINVGGGVAVVLCAEAAQTISSGSLRAYVYLPVNEANTDAGVWPAHLWLPYPVLDFTPSTGNRCAASGDKVSYTGFGRIVWVEDDIAVSGGTTVTITYTRRKGQTVNNGQ